MASSFLTVATASPSGVLAPPPGTALRRDHRIVLRVIESRFSAQAMPSSDIDIFAVARITYSGAPSISGPSSPLSPTLDGGSHGHSHRLDLAPPPPVSGFRKMSLIVGRPPAHSTNDLTGGSAGGLASLNRRSSTTVQVGKTPTLYRVRDSGFFDHAFEVDLVSDVRYIEVELYQKRMLKDSLLGSVVIPGDSLSTHKPLEKWFPVKSHSSAALLSSPTSDTAPILPLSSPTHAPGTLDLALKPTSSTTSSSKSDADSTGITLRIRLAYWNEYLLPLTVYKPLVAVLMDPKMAVISCLERSVDEDRDDVARTLVSVMYSMDMHEPLLIGMATREVQATASPTLLFRANSVASKALDHFMKLVGKQMLDNALRPVIKTIVADNRVCELDRSRLAPASSSSSSSSSTAGGTSSSTGGGGGASAGSGSPTSQTEASSGSSKPNSVDQQLQDNLVALEGYIRWTVERIIGTTEECPRTLRNVFTAMRSAASIRWPMDPHVPYTVVSSFLFLRLFNAAMLGPKLFGLCDVFPNANVSRTLTLVSKSLQQLANGSLFDGAKEPYMTPLNPFLETLIPKVRTFLELMSTPVSRAMPSTRKPSISMHGGPTGHSPMLSPTNATFSMPSMPESGHRTIDRSTSLGVPSGSASESPSSAKSPGGSSASRKKFVKKLFGGGSGNGSSSNAPGSTDGLDHGGGGSSTGKTGKGMQTSKSSMLGGSSGSITAGGDMMKSMDIEREFADLFRILTRIIDVMQKQANDAELPSVNRLAIILRELTSIKERRMSAAPSAALIDAITRARELAAAEGDPVVGSRRSSTASSSANASRRGSLALANSEPFVADWIVSSPPNEPALGTSTLPHAAAAGGGPPGAAFGVTLRDVAHGAGAGGLSDSAPQLSQAATSVNENASSAAAAAQPPQVASGATPPSTRSRVFGFHRPSSGTGSSRSRSSTMSNGRSGLFRGFSLTVDHETPSPSGGSSGDSSVKMAGSQGTVAGANGESPLRSSAPMLVVSGSGDEAESRLVDDVAALQIR